MLSAEEKHSLCFVGFEEKSFLQDDLWTQWIPDLKSFHDDIDSSI